MEINKIIEEIENIDVEYWEQWILDEVIEIIKKYGNK